MKLSIYLSENRGECEKIANKAGTSPAYIRHVAAGRKKRPDAELCIAIERATNGAVRCEELRPDVDWAFLRGTSKSKPKKAA